MRPSRVLSLLMAVPVLGLSSVVAESRPNLVFILADDLSWSDLGCYGHPFHRTPHLDRLASEGMRFTQAYSPAPICSAARAAILTGKTPARLGFEFVTKDQGGTQTLPETPLLAPPFTLNLPLEEVTLAEALAPAGYVSGFFGKWHVSQHHEGYLGWSPTHGPLQQGFAEGDGDFGSHPYAYRADKSLRDSTVAGDAFPEDSLITKATDFLGRHANQRFFLYLSMYQVHDPVHSRCVDRIAERREELPEGSLEIRADYAAMVETLDDHVGQVLRKLDHLGLAEETLVIFMSDNGGHPAYTTNEPLRGSKWNLYEGGIRVPLIVRWPGVTPADSICRTVVHGCDLMPTLSEIVGTPESSAEWDGVSMVELWRNPDATLSRTQPLVWHFPYYHPEKRFAERIAEIGVGDFETSQTRPHSAIRVGTDKLLWFHEQDRLELYRLEDDLGESRDLSATEATVTSRLKSKLETYLEQVKARQAQVRR